VKGTIAKEVVLCDICGEEAFFACMICKKDLCKGHRYMYYHLKAGAFVAQSIIDELHGDLCPKHAKAIEVAIKHVLESGDSI